MQRRPVLVIPERRRARTLCVDPAENIARSRENEAWTSSTRTSRQTLRGKSGTPMGRQQSLSRPTPFTTAAISIPLTLGVTLLLADDGVFVVEVPHALEFVAGNQFDGVSHEHVSQHTVKSFVDHLRLFSAWKSSASSAWTSTEVDARVRTPFVGRHRRINRLRPQWLQRETGHGLFRAVTYDAFRNRVVQNRDALRTLPDDLSQREQGLYSQGMHIRVEGIERLTDDQPDYVLLIAWNFGDVIMRQQRDYRRRRRPVHCPDPRTGGHRMTAVAAGPAHQAPSLPVFRSALTPPAAGVARRGCH